MAFHRKKIFRALKIFIIIYCGIGIALYYLQEKFLFHPLKLEASHQFSFSQKFTEINIPFNKEDTCNLVKFFPKDSARRGVVLYFHGNRENV
ncbi:MAG: alpha/beta hydrolase, partial [Chitinophagaceae bacterium]|nr:alpha/beta hydrolase [Chitinophagaceae bacterium]